MLRITAFLLQAISSLAFATQASVLKDATATPGSIGMVLNTTSVNHVVSSLIPIISYFVLNNQTYQLNLTEKGTLYKFTFNTLHINTVNGFTTKIFEEIPGTDKIHVKLGGINASMNIDAELDALYFIPFKSSQVNLTNITIDFVVEVQSADKVHWQLIDTPQISLGHFQIVMENMYLQKLVELSDYVINLIVNSQMGNIANVIDQQIQAFNKVIAQESAYTFDVAIFGNNMPLNLTMTTAPQIVTDSNLIKINFDGLFDEPQSTNAGFKLPAHDYFPDLPNAHREQFWIHQNTLNSLIAVGKRSFFPTTLWNNSIIDQLKLAVPELQEKYGADANFSLNVDFDFDNEAPFSIDMNRGLVFGDEKGVICNFDVQVLSNGTQDKVLSFVTNFQADLNFTVATVGITINMYPLVQNFSVQSSQLKHQEIPIENHNWDVLFESILTQFFTKWNADSKKGINIAVLDPQIGMIGGLLKNTTLTPHVTDGWYYGGFSMQSDYPVTLGEESENPVLAFLQ